jgi:large subunit ribosomal protein L29
MKTTEIRELNDTELVDKLKAARAELFNLRFQLATGQLDNTARIAVIKKDIARLHTELRSRDLAAQRDAAAS